VAFTTGGSSGDAGSVSIPQCARKDAKAMSGIAKMSLDEFITTYQSPPKDPEGYFHLHGMPPAWCRAVARVPENHLFLYSYVLMTTDANLKKWADVREEAEQVCEDLGDEPGIVWLDVRPPYELQMVSPRRNERKFPAWSENIRKAVVKLATVRYRMRARRLFLVYSCKALLTSELYGTTGFREILENESQSFDRWVATETGKISQFLASIKASPKTRYIGLGNIQ